MVELKWLGKEQREFLQQGQGYIKKGSTPEERYQKICNTIQNIVNSYDYVDEYTLSIGRRFENYVSQGWVSFSSPVLANFGEASNLPISCNHGTIGDNLDSILSELRSVGMLAKYGAGTAKNFSKIRSIGTPISTGGQSDGIMPWIKLYDTLISSVNQGSVRRGFLTAYLSADHEEILDFLDIGSPGNQIQRITTAVTLPKGFRDALKKGDKKKRTIWAKILKRRSELGYPYILDEENCNKNYPKVYEDKGLWIDNGNICIEAVEYCDDEKEFACCLSSVNMAKYDDWREHEYFLKDMYLMLDCVISEYVEKGDKLQGIGKAIKFANEHRAIGLGVLGFHTYLQMKMIPMGSMESFGVNNKVFSKMREEGEKATKWMAEKWGEPEFLKGYGRRNTSLMAQAPTKSTSMIMGMVSSGIEPIKSNYHEKALAKIQVEYKNPELKNLLVEKGKDTREVWKTILENNGSVLHLDFLTEHEKNVFKTFSEISQADLLSLAAARQKYIDMGQSINLMIHPATPPKEVNKLILDAFDNGVKSLYYQYSINAAQEFNKELLECSSCEG